MLRGDQNKDVLERLQDTTQIDHSNWFHSSYYILHMVIAFNGDGSKSAFRCTDMPTSGLRSIPKWAQLLHCICIPTVI